MRSLVGWMLLAGIALALLSAITLGDFFTLPLGPFAIIVLVASLADPTGFTGVCLGAMVTILYWLFVGVVMRFVFCLFTPQEGY